MLGVNGYVLDIGDPVPDKCEKGASPFSHSLLPFAYAEDLFQAYLVGCIPFVLLDHFVEVAFPVKHYFEHILALASPADRAGLVKVELGASPLLDFGVVRFSYNV